jgi:predicted RNA-binding protein YlxR (DUF448 family)
MGSSTRHKRTNAVDRKRHAQQGLVRWFLGPDETPWPDWGGRSERLGRGVWVEPTEKSIRQALERRVFERGFERESLQLDADVLVRRARERGEERFFNQLGLANRARQVSIGQAAVRAEFSGCYDGLLLVASDAGEAGQDRYGRSAETKGVPVVAVTGGNRLGAALGREFVSVVWVQPGVFAEELTRIARALFTLDSAAVSGYVAASPDARNHRSSEPPSGKG